MLGDERAKVSVPRGVLSADFADSMWVREGTMGTPCCESSTEEADLVGDGGALREGTMGAPRCGGAVELTAVVDRFKKAVRRREDGRWGRERRGGRVRAADRGSGRRH